MKISKAMAFAICGACLAVSPASAATILHDVSVNAATAALLAPDVDTFRSQLEPLNAPDPVNGDPAGRRQINWDAAPDAVSDPNAFPGDFFNFGAGPRARGIEFSATGATTGFLLSSTAASGQPVGFGFDASFVPFSQERLFAPIGGTTFDVTFFDPADQVTPAASRGLGVVFSDVQIAALTTMTLFDRDGNVLAERAAEIGPSGSLSFVGVVFDEAVIAKASFNAGNLALLGNGVQGSTGADGVVLDDFIFGEPLAIPLPAPFLLLASALAGLVLVGRGRLQA